MSVTRTFTGPTGSMAGKTFTGAIRRAVVGETNGEITLAAGSVGVLTTRTDNDTGVITLTAGHGQTSGVFDVYWGGATPGCHRGMTAVITVNSMTIDGGTGDNLPLAATDVIVDKQEIIDFDSDNASLALVTVSQQRRASVQFQETAGTPIKSLDLGKDPTAQLASPGEGWDWAINTDVPNPFGAVISKIAVSNGSIAGTNTITVAAGRS